VRLGGVLCDAGSSERRAASHAASSTSPATPGCQPTPRPPFRVARRHVGNVATEHHQVGLKIKSVLDATDDTDMDEQEDEGEGQTAAADSC
jgi:hypothetical protein